MGRDVVAGDADLLASAAAGDGDAFAAFYRRHVGAVTGLAVRLGVTPDEVADIVSETFIVALDRAESYVPQSDSARPWLLGIGWRVAQHGFRRHVRQARLQRRAGGNLPRYTDDEADAVAAAVDAARLTSELEAAVGRLSRSERQVFELVAQGGLTPAEVAIALGISGNAARVRLSRARRRLRRHAVADGRIAAIDVRENEA
jgi:RNA polymerase sigma factor (sigma-70 family)